MCVYSFLNIKRLRSETFSIQHAIVTFVSQLSVVQCSKYSRNIQSCGKVLFYCTLYIRFPGDVSSLSLSLEYTNTDQKFMMKMNAFMAIFECVCISKSNKLQNENHFFSTFEAVDMCLHATLYQ